MPKKPIHAGAIVAANLVDLVSKTESLSTLTSLVVKSGLVDALKGSNLTVFAPTNKAFESLEEMYPGVTAFLTKPENKGALREVLKYHVVPKKVLLKDAIALGKHGRMVLPTEKKGSTLQAVYYPKAKLLRLNFYVTVKTADLETENGSVAHVVDNVLVPMDILSVVEKKLLM
jgi:uncharacterized surface protein with fasciclin (FAS1) repeats